MPEITLLEYLKAHPHSGKFTPQPFVNRTGNMIMFFWDDEPSYADEIQTDAGVNVGKKMIGMQSGKVTGVEIYLEAVGINVREDSDSPKEI